MFATSSATLGREAFTRVTLAAGDLRYMELVKECACKLFCLGDEGRWVACLVMARLRVGARR